jgi:hypothetical protein
MHYKQVSGPFSAVLAKIHNPSIDIRRPYTGKAGELTDEKKDFFACRENF